LKNRDEWRAYCKGLFLEKAKLPDNIPKAPWIVYEKEGWKGIRDWLGY